MRKSLIALTAFALSTGVFGCSRGVEDVYTFKYHGQSAVIKHENRIFDFDNYWIQIGKDTIQGTITSDDNKEISVNSNNNSYSIKDLK